MVKFNSNDDFILYNEIGDILLIGVNTGVNNIYTVCKTHILSGDDLKCAKRFVTEHFNSLILTVYLEEETFLEIPVILIHDFWKRPPLINSHAPMLEILKIIDDGLSMGFEYKVDNHSIYCREVIR